METKLQISAFIDQSNGYIESLKKAREKLLEDRRLINETLSQKFDNLQSEIIESLDQKAEQVLSDIRQLHPQGDDIRESTQELAGTLSEYKNKFRQLHEAVVLSDSCKNTMSLLVESPEELIAGVEQAKESISEASVEFNTLIDERLSEFEGFVDTFDNEGQRVRDSIQLLNDKFQSNLENIKQQLIDTNVTIESTVSSNYDTLTQQITDSIVTKMSNELDNGLTEVNNSIDKLNTNALTNIQTLQTAIENIKNQLNGIIEPIERVKPFIKEAIEVAS
jgi:ABC-type transporter Mla subunit MlaD